MITPLTEFTIGIYMEKLVDAPVLPIKTAWGGKSLHTDFRPPSAGPHGFNNVATVLTEKYWDRGLKAALAKDNEIKQQAEKLAKEANSKPAEEKMAHEKQRTAELTERERLVLENGISNAEFHYLGSAKILAGVGKGLAESMAELKQPGLRN